MKNGGSEQDSELMNENEMSIEITATLMSNLVHFSGVSDGTYGYYTCSDKHSNREWEMLENLYEITGANRMVIEEDRQTFATKLNDYIKSDNNK